MKKIFRGIRPNEAKLKCDQFLLQTPKLQEIDPSKRNNKTSRTELNF